MRKLLPGIATAFIALTLDQLSKWYLLSVIDMNNRATIEVTPFFNLAMVWNYGISFGMFSKHNQPVPLIILSLAICAILLHWMSKPNPAWMRAAIGLVIGGALGNVADRLRLGAVADFFDFHLLGYHWPAFNIADACIFIGVVLLCIDSMFMARTKDRL